jgi:hypothetical protein
VAATGMIPLKVNRLISDLCFTWQLEPARFFGAGLLFANPKFDFRELLRANAYFLLRARRDDRAALAKLRGFIDQNEVGDDRAGMTDRQYPGGRVNLTEYPGFGRLEEGGSRTSYNAQYMEYSIQCNEEKQFKDCINYLDKHIGKVIPTPGKAGGLSL